MTAALKGGEDSAARPGRTLPRVRTGTILQESVWPQGLSGGAESLVPNGILSRTVQPVAQSLHQLSYRAHNNNNSNRNKYLIQTFLWKGSMPNIIADQKKFQGEFIISFPLSYRYYENSLSGLENENL